MPHLEVVRLAIVPSNGAAIAPSQLDSDVAVSPDGSRVAYLSLEQGRLVMYVRALDRIESLRIEGAVFPRLPSSPRMARRSASSTEVRSNASRERRPNRHDLPITAPGLGASWGEDGSIVDKDNGGKGLKRVSDTGGEAVQITTEMNGESHVLPEFLPGATCGAVHPHAGRIAWLGRSESCG